MAMMGGAELYPGLPMPGMMLPVSCSGLLVSEEAKARMKEIDPRDFILRWDMFEKMERYVRYWERLNEVR